MKTTKLTYQFKKEAPNQMIEELATLYTVEFVPENKVMQMLDLSINTLKNWYNMGLGRYKIDGKFYVKKSELNGFIEKFRVQREEVQHVKLAL